MRLTCAAFHQASSIPTRFTCDGENISPAFSWGGAPPQTKCFALTIHDPDAPKAGGLHHWVLYNVPAGTHGIPNHLPHEEQIAGTGIQGENDFGQIGYTGPCPVSGIHRYLVRLYALDAALNLPSGASHQQLKEAMRGHILEQAELMGTYARASRKAA